MQITTANDRAAIEELKEAFGLDAPVHEGMVMFNVEAGEEFVPRLFAKMRSRCAA